MKENNNLSKITAVILAVSMVLGTVASIATTALNSDTPSLDYIEAIKQQKKDEGSAFIILEVAPDASQSTMGYYVKDREPIAGWLDDLAQERYQSDRENNASTLFGGLRTAGILGEDDSAPLKSLGDYNEYYPWEYEALSNGDKENTNELLLENQETINDVQGKFVEDSNGSYNVDTEYALPSLFSLEDWFTDLKENHYGNNGLSISGGSATYENGKVVIDTPATASSADAYTQHSFGRGNSSYYKISCEPNTEYEMIYTVELEGPGRGQIFFFEYPENYTDAIAGNADGWHTAKSQYPTTSGTYHLRFTTADNAAYLGFRCGTASALGTKATFSDVMLVKVGDEYAGADAVQDPTEFYYGNASASTNLFDFEQFYESLNSYDPNIYYDYVSTLTVDAHTSTPVFWTYTEASAQNHYMVPIDQSADYTFTYTVNNIAKTDGQHVQSEAWVIGLSEDDNNEVLVKDDDRSESGTYQFTITSAQLTEKNIKYLVFKFGAMNDNTIAEFSDVSLVSSVIEADTSGQYYYYDVNFEDLGTGEEIINDSVHIEDGTNLYIEITDSNKEFGETVGKYKLAGAYYSNSMGLIVDVHTHYYIPRVNRNVGPLIYYNEATNNTYRTPRDSEYHLAKTEEGEIPYFTSNSGIGTYVGAGFGDYKLDTTKIGTVTVKTSIVYYTGGYESNDWFKYRVLDWNDEKDAFPVVVTTVTPEELDNYSSHISSFDLIVFTSGTQTDGTAGTFTSDLSADFMAKYGVEGTSPYYDLETPTVYDKAILDNTDSSYVPNMKTLLSQIRTSSARNSTSTGWVTEFVYCYSSADTTGTSNMANGSFSTNVTTSLYNTSGKPYNDVYKEITYENVIRSTGSPAVNPLPVEVSEATAIRYILNFKGQRIVFNKDTLKILDIEPYTSGKVFSNGILKAISDASIAYQYPWAQNTTLDTHDTTAQRKVLTEEQFLSWFPDSSKTNGKLFYDVVGEEVKYVDVQIITMAANEVIADADDIAETYDLVYIGDSTYNMSTKIITDRNSRAFGSPNAQPVYNDTTMEGMYYTSTGDIMYTNARNFWAEGTLGGILSDDYTWFALGSSKYAFLEGWNEFKQRSSGNDITAVKEEQLENFIRAGLPVVVADELTTGANAAIKAMQETTQSITNYKEWVKLKDLLPSWLAWAVPSFIKIKRRVVHYHIDLYAWVEGMPSEFNGRDNVTFKWYFQSNNSTEATYFATSGTNDYTTYTIRSGPNAGTTILASKFSWEIPTAAMTDWQGYFYATAQIHDTGEPKLDTAPMLYTNRTKTELADRRVYYQSTRDLVKRTGTEDDGYDFEEYVNPALLDNDQKPFYLSTSASCEQYYFVRFYSDNSYNINKRLWDVVGFNNWYRFHKGLTSVSDSYDEIDKEAIRYLDYIRQGPTDHCDHAREICEQDGYYNWVWHTHSNRRGYTKFTYVKSGSETGELQIGTPEDGQHNSDHPSSGSFVTEYLKITQAPVEEGTHSFGGTYELQMDANISSVAVDNTSYMYKFLDYAFNGDADNETGSFYGANVFAERDFRNNNEMKNKLATFIEFSGPQIVAEESSVVAYPDITTDRKISVKFTIQNPTGVGAANDRFKLNLYVDLDSDGKFKPAEMQQGLVVEEQLDNGAFAQIENNALKATTKSATYTYHVYKELPSDYAGLLPWKIEIIKLDKNNKWSVDGSDAIGSEVNYSNLHDSYQNYCYVRPEEASVINILQILPSDWDMTYRPSGNQGGNGNLYTGTVFESDTFKELIGENKNWFLVPKGDGDVSDTVYMMFGPTNEEGGMDDYSAYYHYYIEHGGKMMGYSGLVPDFFCILNCINVEDLNNEFDGGQDVQGYKKRKYNNNYLDKYNMVIMGFADSWGKGGRINNGTSWSTNVGLNMSAAFALQDYIDDGKALLLTHDTTTVYNNFPNNRILAAGINAANWIVDKISDALGAISGFLESIFGHNAASNGLSSGQAWLNRIQLNPDERERNGYWVNLLRDACGLDRYGVTYAIKEKAKTHDANLYSCKTENCRYKSYTAFTTCPKCGNKNVETTPVYSVTDKTLVNGYYTDEAEGHKDIIYGSGTTLTNDYPYDTSVNTMLANDYSIAYVPGSAVKNSNGTVTKSYDKYVGGYTRHTLTRYSEQASTAHVPTLTMYNSDNNTYDTTYITQTNKGQITCYPYDINIYKRDANGRRIIDENGGYMFDENGTMLVSSTHEQIYQLNMNGDDITCWYCMSGDEFADIPNDAVNTYYIYSRKNITYTGAGHTNTFTPEEAKLFANTLIAAYRPSTEPATAEFVSSENEYNNSYRKTGYILLTDDKQRDEDGDTTAEKIVNEEVHFRLNNKNLAKVGSTWASVDVTYSYVDANGETQTGVINTNNAPLYYGAKAEGETTENWSHLEKNGVYTFEVPAEVLNALKEEGVTEVTLVITPTTYLEGSDDAPGIADTVKVRLLGLSSLR